MKIFDPILRILFSLASHTPHYVVLFHHSSGIRVWTSPRNAWARVFRKYALLQTQDSLNWVI